MPPARSALTEFQHSNAREPPEISRIRNGIVSFFVGGSINDGIITWYAYDSDRWLFVAVLGSAGPRLKEEMPKRLSKNQFVRTTSAAGYQRREFVTVVRAAAAQSQKIASAANRLLAAASHSRRCSALDNPFDPFPQSDVLVRRLDVFRNGQAVTINVGSVSRELEDALENMVAAPLQQWIKRAQSGS